MVTREQLRALDFSLWLGSGKAAAGILHCNQSTVSRQCRTVIRRLGLSPGGPPRSAEISREHPAGWGEELLALERQVHQMSRFQRAGELRLHAYLWTSLLHLQAVAPGWVQPPWNLDVSSTDALALLEHRVIDAFLAPAPACPPPEDSRFAVIPLYALPLEVLSCGAGSLPEEHGLAAAEVARELPLHHLPFVPPAARRCSLDLDAVLFGAVDGTVVGEGYRCYGNALSRLLVPELGRLDLETGILFEESLVVLQDHADRRPVRDLVAALHRQLRTLQDHHRLELDLRCGAATP
ncbi:MAG: hypothetical protein VKI81_01745 [Synechococcaceae cyanobacterium]|nr:hypothetical protein [Synechococcaceae cyanobacterium]